MTTSFRFFAKCTTYYEKVYEAENLTEAQKIAETNLLDGTWNELSSNEPEIYDSTEVDS
jgi:hypothetical protein